MAAATTTTSTLTPDTTPAPKMSAQDFRLFNRLAEEMSYYHSRFRSTWDTLYAGTAPSAKKPSPHQLILLGLQFCAHLKGHHDIEEAYWFPYLGRKMEAFRAGGFAKEQHEEMHKGLDVLEEYLNGCRSGERELRREEVRNIMEGFKEVLWKHLDEEIVELEAKNMMNYWTVEEMKRFPF